MDVTWSCPVDVQECEAFLLALCLRLYASKNTDASGRQTWRRLGSEKMEVRLTKQLADAVLPHFSYLRHKVRCSPFVLKQDHVVDLVLALVEDEQEAELVKDRWHDKHAAIREQARRDLYELADAGFVCRA